MKPAAFLLLLLSLPVATNLSAQTQGNNEVSFSYAGMFSSDGRGQTTCVAAPCQISQFAINPAAAGAWGGSYAHRLADFKAGSLFFELPLYHSRSRKVNTQLSSFGPTYGSTFIAPSVKWQFLPGARISPFGSLGLGVAHFNGLGFQNDTAALQFGGGLDVKTPIRFMTIRGEVRDFLSGRPKVERQLLQNVFTPRQHNVFPSAGVAFHF